MKSLLPLSVCCVLAVGMNFAWGQQTASIAQLQANDVVALIGGEDMVACAEAGILEAYVLAALPEARIKFRCLAWEGDTVFEQPRQVNYPPLEKQLDEIGATVVLADFGQMESVEGDGNVAAFSQAYERLIERCRGKAGARRVILIEPHMRVHRVGSAVTMKAPHAYVSVIRDLAVKMSLPRTIDFGVLDEPLWALRDDVHLHPAMQEVFATRIVRSLTGVKVSSLRAMLRSDLVDLATAKHRLWERYRRPQNWAFLAGDRVSQPSSRDHLDPSKRWFPEEMKEYLPLIESKERQIWEITDRLAGSRR